MENLRDEKFMEKLHDRCNPLLTFLKMPLLGEEISSRTVRPDWQPLFLDESGKDPISDSRRVAHCVARARTQEIPFSKAFPGTDAD